MKKLRLRRDPSPNGKTLEAMLSGAEVRKALHVVSLSSTSPVALAGGVAMVWYGSPRLTGDVDIVAESPLHTGPELKKRGLLSFGGVKYVAGRVPVDVIIRKDEWENLYRDALGWSRSATGLPKNVRLVTPEYLLVMKMVAGRPKDKQDAMYLAAHSSFRMTTARKLVKKYLGSYSLSELEQLRVMGLWEAGRRK